MPLAFPAHQPAEIGPLAESLMDALGPLVTDTDRRAVLQALDGTPFRDVASVGLEVTLPPHAPACDLSLLLAPGLVPAFVSHPALHRLARETAERESGSTWWELDASTGGSTGGFIRMLDGVDGPGACRDAIGDRDPSLTDAVERIGSIVNRFGEGAHVLMGFFPDRIPPTAACLLPTYARSLPRVVEMITESVTTGPVSVFAPQDSRVQGFIDAFGGMSVAVGCDGQGRMGIAVEFGFSDRVPAMIDRRWDEVLARVELGPSADAVPYLLATQAIHDFRDLFPLTVLSGIDHLKITPDGRLKAYVGALPFQRGVGINGLPPGSP